MKKQVVPNKGPHLIVHLGNAGKNPEKTRRYARRFADSNIHFWGIDRLGSSKRHNNWTQIKTGFLSGLNRLRDSSVKIISSELALGFFPKFKLTPYVGRVLHASFRKLKPGGKLYLVVTEKIRDSLLPSLQRAGFPTETTEVRFLKTNEYNRTYWTRQCRISEIPLIQIIAEKSM